MKFKKILHVISSVNPKGGGPIEGVKSLAVELKRVGIEVECVSCDCPNDPWVINFPIKIYALGPAWFNYSYAQKLFPWLKRSVNNYDAIFVNGIWQYTSFAVWRTLSGGRVPYYVFTHGMLDPWFKKTYPLKHLKKWLYWPWGEYRVLRDAKAVIFTCKTERDLAAKSFWLYRCNAIVVNYGISEPPKDVRKYQEIFYAKFPLLRDKRVFLYLSRICEKKGCDLLIEAFSKVAHLDPAIYLVMAGPDQEGWTSRLKEQVDRCGISERIVWPGMLEGDDKWGAFHSAEVFCLPSHQENFGIVVAEALACSKPVLISNQVNIYQEIEASGAGIVEPDTLEGTCIALKKWIQMLPAEANIMKLAARDCYEAHFSVYEYAKQINELISENLEV